MVSARSGELFDDPARASDARFAPLAERMRPRTLEEFVGQRHLLGPGRPLARAIAADRLPSMVLWGPPGTGKTTLARLMASRSGAAFETLSAVSAGVKEIREVIERAQARRRLEDRSTLLFVDEIHRFNKLQQDALLPHVEAGVCRLVGATTENPSFEVNAALLSRLRVFALQGLAIDDIADLLTRALHDRERGLGERGITAAPELLRALASGVAGDARRALGELESVVDMMEDGVQEITAERIAAALGRRPLRYDKAGEEHYNVVSAFIKSMRASDPDAAVYWLVRMVEAGEDPMFIARRLVIFAAEDVSNADPQALVLAQAAASATHLIGLPEAVLPLTQATLYLALAPKSNSALASYAAARKDVQRWGALPVPLAIRNAVTRMMKEAGYGTGYRYPHDLEGGVDRDHTSYLPERLAEATLGRYVRLAAVGWEAEALRALRSRRSSSASEAGAAEAATSSPSVADAAERGGEP